MTESGLQKNIVLTGFMGTGKSAVGREIAARLARPFVDLDELIAQRAGRSIAEIFATEGEAAFREREAAACQEVRAPAGLVVAAGGGAVLDVNNAAALQEGGLVVCLDADAETITRRLAGQDGRPLLSGPDRPARIAALLAQRAGAYAAIRRHLDTSSLSVAAAAEIVMGMAAGLPEGGRRIPVRIGEWAPEAGAGGIHYDVLLADGLLEQAGQRLAEAGLRPGPCAIVTNPVVRRYAPRLVAALGDAGFEPRVFEIPDGETYKTLATVEGLYRQFAAARMARGEPVLALGGGVTGDLAGFMAATWLRGVPFVQVPTSLLAMVDASVGGKVGVDLPEGKNLVGAFKQPAVVLVDPTVLATLSGPEFRSGLAEVLKSAMVGAPALFEQMAAEGPASLVSMIADAVRVKVRLVERDPLEAGDRAWLNLGHTFGHALEVFSGFTLRHGEAVALGLIAAAELSAGLEHCPPSLAERTRSIVGRLGLPTCYVFDVERVRALMEADKKRAGRSLRFVLLRGVGDVSLVQNVAAEAVAEALRAIQPPDGKLPPSTSGF